MKLCLLLSVLVSASATLTTEQISSELWSRWLAGDSKGWCDLYADGAVITWNNPSEEFKYDGTHVVGQNGFTMQAIVDALNEQYTFTDLGHSVDYLSGGNIAFKMHLVLYNKHTGTHNRYDMFAPVETKNGKATSTAWNVYKVTPVPYGAAQLSSELWRTWLAGDSKAWCDLYADGAVITWNNPSEEFKYDGTHIVGQNGFTMQALVDASNEQYEFTGLGHSVDYLSGDNLAFKMYLVLRNKHTGTHNRYDMFTPIETKNGKATSTAWNVYKVTPVGKDGKEL